MASATSCKDPREVYALKQKAVKYYEENGVPVKMEEVLNSMFYENPPDVYGHLVNFFAQFTKPAVLNKVQAMQVYDCNGLSTIKTDVYCIINNLPQLVSSSIIPSANIKARAEDREKAELDLHESVQAAIKIINSEMADKLSGMDPLSQMEIDTLLSDNIEEKKEEELTKRAKEAESAEETASVHVSTDDKDKRKSSKGKGGKSSAPLVVIPDRPPEFFAQGSEAAAAVSQAVCACAASTKKIPIYRHIGNLARTKGALNEFRIPLPMVTIIQSGKPAPGKVNCVKEYMIVPGVGLPIDKSIEHIQQIYSRVSKSFSAKLGPLAKMVNETGALTPTLDSPTQALDLLQEAVNAQGLTIGEDIYIALDVSAHEFFDHEKGKYEVMTGQLKSPDDMVDFWADIVSKYPSIVALIDPIRGEDSEQWMRLCERVSEGMFIIGNTFYERPGVLMSHEPPTNVQTSGIVLNIEKVNTVSDIIACANRYQDLNNEIVISANQGDTTDTFIVDLAVGLNARFLKLGGPCRGERSCKLNRLLQIVNELEPPREGEELPTDRGEESAEEKEKGAEVARPPEDSARKETGTPTETAELSLDEDLQDKEAGESPEAEPEVQTWGAEENSRLKLHSPFVFPLVENPPVVEDTGEEEAEADSKPEGSVKGSK